MTHLRGNFGALLVRVVIALIILALGTVLVCLIVQWWDLLLYGIALQYAGIAACVAGILMNAEW